MLFEYVETASLLCVDMCESCNSDKTATGVEFVFDNRVHPGAPQEIHTIRATKLVVVAAGAFGSPAILERSGIGAVEVVKAAGIAPLVDLPGVGANYHGGYTHLEVQPAVSVYSDTSK